MSQNNGIKSEVVKPFGGVTPQTPLNPNQEEEDFLLESSQETVKPSLTERSVTGTESQSIPKSTQEEAEGKTPQGAPPGGNFDGWQLINGRLKRKAYRTQVRKGLSDEATINYGRKLQAKSPTSTTRRTPTTRRAPTTRPTRPSYSQVAAPTKVGILSGDPQKPLFTYEELEQIREVITESIVDLFDGELFPAFHGIQCRTGFLVANTANADTSKWLTKHIEAISKAAKVVLKVVKEEDIPPTQIVAGHFSRASDLPNDKILAHIAAQNRNLPALKWQVVKKIPIEGGDPRDALTYLAIDEKSADEIKRNRHRIHFRLGTVQLFFENRWEANPKPQEQMEVDEEEAKGGPQETAEVPQPAHSRKLEIAAAAAHAFSDPGFQYHPITPDQKPTLSTGTRPKRSTQTTLPEMSKGIKKTSRKP